MKGSAEIRRLIDAAGAINVAHHPELASSLSRMARGGELVKLLPGVYVPAESRTDLRTCVNATMLWCPQAVITGLAAARLSYWRGDWHPPLEVCKLERVVLRSAEVSFHRWLPPSEWIIELDHVRMTHPALTALWLSAHDEGTAIDNGLRLRAFDVSMLTEAMPALGARKHNGTRRHVLSESRDVPWSPAERRCHAVLRRNRITGWKSNYRVRVAGRTYFVDVAFPDLKLALEVDGWEFHHSREDALRDRARNNALTLAGWRVLHVLPSQMDDELAFVGLIRAARQLKLVA